ncbi:DNA-binding transcriptional regulator, Lrp family [Natronoarchaeum philippinense]|uniref:DNA-binding transcriptional regulator, Lrp family n=1 Tax=Natronoarchaeum philippinense TaxID=558529 RepID=A0A285N001_NATPI|nr:AsnC family transcriptional regulator [Natronoarchaeum philippinense]SNZ02760.1 DNA-binding transcriptional regulator, Lrp family [Natronoarchaeum philippinense]
MVELDDTDLNILELLAEDSRRPYSEIAEKVGVSPPTVSDRVDRLEDLGVIERFTLDVDRSTLRDGVGVLVDVHLRPGFETQVMNELAGIECIEHVFATADAHVVAKATVDEAEIHSVLTEAVDLGRVVEYDVRLLVDSAWQPHIDGPGIDATCEECGSSIEGDGVAVEIDGQQREFCSSTCRSAYEEHLETIKQSA